MRSGSRKAQELGAEGSKQRHRCKRPGAERIPSFSRKKSQKKPRWVDPRVRQGLVVDEAGEVGRGRILQGLECYGGDLGMEGM